MFGSAVFICGIAVVLGLPANLNNIPRLDGRIVNGENTTIDEFPHQVSLLHYGSHICGGSIVGPDRILTAAHCTDGSAAYTLSIRAGSSIRNSGGEVIKVKTIYQHPDFTMKTVDFDVSVLVLERHIAIDGAQKIGLTDNEPTDGQKAVVSGWGALYTNGPASDQLQKVAINIISRTECRNQYGADKITDNMICASADEKDACQGDSGGPLVTEDKTTQIGIVSWGYGCADPKHAGVYTNIDALRDYIDKHLWM